MFPISLCTTFAKNNRKKLINMIADFIKKLQQKKAILKPAINVDMLHETENRLLNKQKELSSKIIHMLDNEHVYLDKAISLTRLSAMIGTNTTYLSNTINNYFGCNFNVLINKYRIEECCKLLKDSHLSIKEIASQSGFSSNSTFYVVFKKEKDMSPNQYRALVRKNKIYEPVLQ